MANNSALSRPTVFPASPPIIKWCQGFEKDEMDRAKLMPPPRVEKPIANGVEKAGQRRRRFYKLTAAGQKILAEQRKTWKDFFAALDRVAAINPA